MKRLAAAFTLVLLIASARHTAAETTTSNSGGNTTVTITRVVLTSNWIDVRDDICRGLGWTSQVTCTQAMVDASQCTAGQLGNPVTNPVTCLQAIDAAVRSFLIEHRAAGEIREADDTHVVPVRAANKSAEIQ